MKQTKNLHFFREITLVNINSKQTSQFDRKTREIASAIINSKPTLQFDRKNHEIFKEQNLHFFREIASVTF